MRAVILLIPIAATLVAATVADDTAPQVEVGATVPSVTTPAVNSSSNNTSKPPKFGLMRTCGMLWSYNWDEIQYACAWDHSNIFDNNYNLFFKRFGWAHAEGYPFYAGSVIMECNCDKGLNSYDPWGSRWTFSKSGDVTCYSRDGKHASEIGRLFDRYTCNKEVIASRECDFGRWDCI